MGAHQGGGGQAPGKVLRLGAITQSLLDKAGTNKHRHSGVFTLSL